MTPAQREAAKRLISTKLRHSAWEEQIVALLRELLAEPEPAPGYCKHCRQYTIEEPLPAEPQGEPVAWHVCSVNSDGSLSLEYAASWEEAAHEHINDAINEHDIEDAASWVVRPVYAHPPQQRKPLTREQLWSLPEMRGWFPQDIYRLEAVASAIERHHGIGEPT